MTIKYSKDAEVFVLAWDPDYTKLTKEEEASMLAAEASGFVNEDEIDWDKIGLN